MSQVTKKRTGGGGTTNPALIQPRDIALAVGLVTLALPAWLIPPRYWQGFSRRIAALSSPLLRRRTPQVLAAMDAAVDAPEGRIYNEWIGWRIEEQLQYLREHRLSGWQAELALAGSEHLKQALSGGRGAILWVAPQVMAPLLVKRGLFEAGYPLEHLSREFHGPTESRFGRRFINPVVIGAENRYLAQRHVMQAGHELKALRPLVRALKRGRIVSISCANYGQRLTELDLLGGRLPVATGAASLAISSGASLLPVFLKRLGKTSYCVEIDAPLNVPRSADRADMIAQLASAYAQRLRQRLSAQPAQFSNWRLLRRPDPQQNPS